MSSDLLFPTARKRERETAVNSNQIDVWKFEIASPARILRMYPVAIKRMSKIVMDLNTVEYSI